MKILHTCLLAAASTALAVFPATSIAATPAQAEYTAHIHAMNATTAGSKAEGVAHFRIRGDELTIDINMHGTPANTVHWQHFHGFKDGSPASCPTATADANSDGIVDLMETGKASGTTMVPFIGKPASMDVAHGSYPTADANGDYHYHATVSLKALKAAFAKAFPGQSLDLAKRVIYIHGVPASTSLPDTVASLGPIPAQTTIPIACGKIEPVTH